MKKAIIGILASILIFLVSGSVATSLAGQPIHIIVNGAEKKSDVAPVLIQGRTMAPLRLIAESLGAKVTWDKVSNAVKVTTASSMFTNKYTVEVKSASFEQGVPSSVLLEGGFINIDYLFNGESETYGCSLDDNNDGTLMTSDDQIIQHFKDSFVSDLQRWEPTADETNFNFIGLDKLRGLVKK